MQKKTKIITASAITAGIVLGGAGIAYAVTDGFEGSDAVTGADLDRASKAAVKEVGGGKVIDAERDDNRYELDVLGSDGVSYDVVLDDSFTVLSSRADGDDDRARVSGGAGSGSTSSGSDSDDTAPDGSSGQPGASVDKDDLVGDELAQASEAAIKAAGGGTVVDAERSDDADHRFEVVVRLEDGTEVDVDLDESFGVVRTQR
ncbi:PepSY domain-containing protein [Okibacterium fritillariae]|uniref:Peptidase propeptide and YPEB domain-containing protein n=1 Tax=Okibacterium fritillariae TaxID=123320 RepID=A0A1T5J057_9MICO|nr:PepSY domain-containing protein [Okibacterium fritillariae]SKC44826.1 Peptidase propeptide and YPEB domain-containing protein [Okibacterium fritillariae]